ncbi:helix-turn-helix domain-containing protein [Novosphingobium sp. ST904]|uniref:helix-turn-helix domain-containing protein n=1 Tax=Novosphingobium sp. ST904 TaxID=1684385 RepID=UPI002100EB74|nr:helix-turn-helix transcriptional regulator [Novosphingobium sp. ST904]
MSEAPNRIRELRSQTNPRLSQEALGQMIGVSKVTISDLERGEMALTVDYMRRIADALRVTPADLLSHRDNPDALNLDERHLVEQLRQATPEQREQLQKVADVIAPRPSSATIETFGTRKRA